MVVKDEKLQGNEKIETAIEGLRKEPTQEMLAHALTVIRRRMKEDAELIVAVDPALEGSQLNVHVLRLEDGNSWWMAFTSFEEEIKGANKVMSTFMGNMRQMFEAVLKTDGVDGIIVNPWNRTIMLDKTLIRIILGEPQ
ncbi:MAG: SseB family protein [Clostridiales bacterium]|nr:SseB family protein [Clostridiales bacterium]